MLRWSRFLCKRAPLRGLSGCREVVPEVALIPEYPLGLALELPDPLAGDRKLLAQISEGSWLLAIKAVAADEDATLALGESLDGLHKATRLQLPHHLADHPRLALVLEKIAHLRAAFFGRERLVEAGGIGYGALDILDPLDLPAEPLGNLCVGGLTLEFGGELVVGAGHLPYLLAHVHGHPYGPPFVGDSPLDSLPDPPGGVGGEAEALLGVELVRCSHEAYVALLDEVPEGQPHPTILLCDGDDEPQVLLDELGPRPLVALPCPPAEIYLLLVCKKPSTTDLPEVPGKRVWSLPFIHPAYRLSCYFESSWLCSVLSKGCGILRGIFSPPCLRKAPFWPSSIRPLEGSVSYLWQHVRCPLS